MPTYLMLILLVGTWALFVIRSWRSRRRFLEERDVFRCRIRLVSGQVAGLATTWRGRPGWARWEHEILLVRAHRLFGKNHILPVQTVVGSVSTTSSAAIGSLGDNPAVVQLLLDLGDVVEVAAPASARELVAGPFVVAALRGGWGTPNRHPPTR